MLIFIVLFVPKRFFWIILNDLTNTIADFDPEAPTDWDSLRLERYDIEEGPSSKKYVILPPSNHRSNPFFRFQKAPTKVAMKAEPIMGEKYRGKKVNRKDLAEDVSNSFNSSSTVIFCCAYWMLTRI